MDYSDKDKLRLKTEAIKNGGFYGSNGVWNSIVILPNDNKLYRKRVEVLVINKNKEVFVKKKPNGEYYLPGGSTEKDVPDITQAANECREEARFNLSKIIPTGLSYKVIYDNIPSWVSKENIPIIWEGMITDIYIGIYDGLNHEHVNDVDKDSFIKSGRFYPISECNKFFRPEHKKALSNYLSSINESNVTESYIVNYFKNKKFLKELVSNKDISASVVDSLINLLDKSYLELRSKSSIQRELKDPDLESIFHPVTEFMFPDNQSITLCISFFDQLSPAYAVNTEKFGDLVILNPRFFKLSKDVKSYVLLHEIGHIRLGHTKYQNLHKTLFGKVDTDDHRYNSILKGKVMYPEVNADLYAVLNGAKMYAILKNENKDIDSKYDYRITNAEQASRYSKVFNFYNRYVGESVDDDLDIYEFTDYDFMLLSLNDFIYENEYISSLEDKEKEVLYGLIYSKIITEVAISSPKNINTIADKMFFERSEYNSYYKGNKYNNYPMIVSFNKRKEDASNIINEAALSLYNSLSKSSSDIAIKYRAYLEAAMKRKNLPDSKFGNKEQRKYPLDTRKHVLSAIRLFGHCEDKYKKEVASAIFSAMKRYHIPMSVIGNKNSLRNYL